MRGLGPWCVAGVVLSGGCLDIPAHQPGGIDAPACVEPLDCDGDGWPATAGNPAASDCNDGDAAIHPGAADDPDTPADEDCIADGSGNRLTGVTGGAGGLVTGALTLGFGSPTRMPMSLQVLGVEALASEGGCHPDNEQGMGIGLWPAFASSLAGGPEGTYTVERSGPAMATARVTWAGPLDDGDGNQCAGGANLGATLRFTVLPNLRLVREDIIDVDAQVTSCEGCGRADLAPWFTSFVSLVPGWNRVAIDGAAEAEFPAAETRLDTTEHTACVRQASGPGRLAMTWTGTTATGIRLRQTAAGNHALVYDWTRGATVGATEHRAVTTMVVDTRLPAGACTTEQLENLGEVVAPPAIAGLDYLAGLGVYQPPSVPAGALSFVAMAPVRRGFAVRSEGLGDRGVTVWLQEGDAGSPVRLVRDWHYLVQRDPDGATVVFVPSLAMGHRLTIAGPGREPPP